MDQLLEENIALDSLELELESKLIEIESTLLRMSEGTNIDSFVAALESIGNADDFDVITSTVKDLEESVSTYISENSIELDESLADSLTRHTANAIQSIQHATRRAKVSIKRTKAGTRIRRELGRRKSADRNRNTVTASIKPSARRKRARLAEQARQAEIRQRGMQQAAQSHIYHANQRRRMGYA